MTSTAPPVPGVPVPPDDRLPVGPRAQERPVGSVQAPLAASATNRPAIPSSTLPTAGYRRSTRLLEILPGLITWLLILLPVALSFRFPELVAWFVL
ncbi:MAG: hypothetical protein ACR2JZ_06560, partial [Candidatus Limnocylindrales bacterium]